MVYSDVKDLSVALIVFVAILLLLGMIFLLTLAVYLRQSRGYNVGSGKTESNVAKPGRGESSNIFLNKAYSNEKMNY